MLPSVENYNCYEYLKHCTSIYPDVWMMQHFGVKYRKSEMFRDIDALSAYFQNDLRLKKGDVYTVFMTTTVQGILTFYALNQIGVIANIVHPLMSTDYLKETLEDVHAKGVMILDILSKDHVKTINDSGLPCIVCSSSDYAEGIKNYGTMAGEKIAKAVFPIFKNAIPYSRAVSKYKTCEPCKNNADDIADNLADDLMFGTDTFEAVKAAAEVTVDEGNQRFLEQFELSNSSLSVVRRSKEA